MDAAVKKCCVCGTDIAHANGIKDAGNSYYCALCHENHRAQSADTPADPSNDPYELRAAPAPGPRAQPAKSIPKAAPKPPAIPPAPELAAQVRFIHTLPGGLLVAVLMLVVTVAIMIGLQLAFPQETVRGVPVPAITSIVSGGLISFGVVVLAAMLLFSMFILDRIMGGVDFGFIGLAIAKALGICLVLTALILLAPIIEHLVAFEGIGWLVLLVRSILLLVGFMVLFHLDFFEAVVLSFVNFLVSMVVLFVVGGILGGAIRWLN